MKRMPLSPTMNSKGSLLWQSFYAAPVGTVIVFFVPRSASWWVLSLILSAAAAVPALLLRYPIALRRAARIALAAVIVGPILKLIL